MSSSYTIMLFFVIAHNTHDHKTHYVGGKLSNSKFVTYKCRLESKLFNFFFLKTELILNKEQVVNLRVLIDYLITSGTL